MSGARPHAALFDAVGTLIHLREPVGVTYARLAGAGDPGALQAAFEAALRARPAMVFPGHPVGEVHAAERAWWEALVTDVFAAAGAALPAGAFDVLWRHFAAAAAWRAADDAHDTLRAVRRAGVRTGVVSNFDHRLPALLDALDLADWFETVVLPADAGAAKPAARIFHLALSRLGVAPADAIYVGDDPRDDRDGATAAGLRYCASLAAARAECGA